MNKTISKLLKSRENREGYIRAKLNHLIPSQIRALRLHEEWTQKELASESDMKQARISAVETPGAVNFSLETLIRLAAAYRVALQVRFVPYSQLRDWEDRYSQDHFTVQPLEKDDAFTGGKRSEEVQLGGGLEFSAGNVVMMYRDSQEPQALGGVGETNGAMYA